MKTLTKIILIVAVALTVFSVPAVAVDEPDFNCFPFDCGPEININR